MVREITQADSGAIQIKIAPLMGEVKEYSLSADSTIADALATAGFSSNSEVRITETDGSNKGIVNNTSVLDGGELLTVVSSGKIEAGL